MAKRRTGKWRVGRIAALFFLLLLLLVFLRFPYGELKGWAISTLSRKAGLHLVMKESSLLFPFGVEMRDVKLRAQRPDLVLILPGMEKLLLKASIFDLLSEAKTVHFEIVSGGKGKGKVTMQGKNATLEIDAADLEAAGLVYGSRVAVEKGLVSLTGRVDFPANYLEGEGDMTAAARGIRLIGVSPFVPILEIDSLQMTMVKNGREVVIRTFKADIDGITVTGKGKINVMENLEMSRIDMSADVDVSGARQGPLQMYVPLLTGMAGQKSRFNVLLSGTARQPRVTLDGKRLM